MFGLLALMSTVTPPFGSSAPFQCTPSHFNFLTGILKCEDGFEIKLWGLALNDKLPESSAVQALTSSFRAANVTADSRGFEITGAPQMQCYSKETGKRRISQCFVRGRGIFGGEDLACLLIGEGVATASPFARDYYSHCPRNSIKIERGE